MRRTADETIDTPTRLPAILEHGTGNEVQQERAAEVLADGGRIREAAEAAGVNVKTIQRWLDDDPTFGQYLIAIRELMRSSRWAKRERHVAGAFDVVDRAMHPERYPEYEQIHPEDPRVPIALAILQQTEHAIYNPDQRADVSIRKRKPGIQTDS